jgi:IclR family transcriptional regulator, acetate operon repressor
VSAPQAYFASRAMCALELLAFGPATASVVADALQVHPRTARRLLARLVEDGWLTCQARPRPTYAPTLRVLALAGQQAARTPLLCAARQPVTELAASTEETVHLAIPSYRSTLRLLRARPREDAAEDLRDLAPAHATAAGKLLLAHRAAWRESVLRAPLEAATPHTITDPHVLDRDCRRILSRGYALERGELDPDIHAIAAPITTIDGETVAALALSTRERSAPHAHRDALLSAARRLCGPQHDSD